MTDINSLNKNKEIVLNGIKRDIILIPPISDAKTILFIFTFLLRIIDTQKSKIKSKKKLIIIIKSMYIFINYSPLISIKKRH